MLRVTNFLAKSMVILLAFGGPNLAVAGDHGGHGGRGGMGGSGQINRGSMGGSAPNMTMQNHSNQVFANRNVMTANRVMSYNSVNTRMNTQVQNVSSSISHAKIGIVQNHMPVVKTSVPQNRPRDVRMPNSFVAKQVGKDHISTGTVNTNIFAHNKGTQFKQTFHTSGSTPYFKQNYQSFCKPGNYQSGNCWIPGYGYCGYGKRWYPGYCSTYGQFGYNYGCYGYPSYYYGNYGSSSCSYTPYCYGGISTTYVQPCATTAYQLSYAPVCSTPVYSTVQTIPVSTVSLQTVPVQTDATVGYTSPAASSLPVLSTVLSAAEQDEVPPAPF